MKGAVRQPAERHRLQISIRRRFLDVACGASASPNYFLNNAVSASMWPRGERHCPGSSAKHFARQRDGSNQETSLELHVPLGLEFRDARPSYYDTVSCVNGRSRNSGLVNIATHRLLALRAPPARLRIQLTKFGSAFEGEIIKRVWMLL